MNKSFQSPFGSVGTFPVTLLLDKKASLSVKGLDNTIGLLQNCPVICECSGVGRNGAGWFEHL